MESKTSADFPGSLNLEDRIIIENLSSTQMNEYEKVRLLGNGTFSQVWECLEIKTGMKFAVKIISKNFLLKHNLHDQFTKEIRIHFELDHPNIVKLFKVFESQANMYLVLELGENGTLADLIERRGSLSEVEACYYTSGVLAALKYIHDKNILHRDLKPANLILTRNLDIKIADFGLAAYIPKTKRRRKTFCGTPFYIAPEIITKEGHSYEVDYWSIGIILYNMIYGKCPFQKDVPDEVYKLILDGHFRLEKTFSAEVNELISALLERNVEKRAKYQDVIESSFFRKANKVKCLPQSTLQTAPSESFISLINEEQKIIKRDNCEKLQKNVYKKSNSKFSSGFEDLLIKESEDYEYIKKWVNFSDKFGVGGILNNGIICIFFNDTSKIVLSNFGITFHYIGEKESGDSSVPTYNVLKYPKELEKKVKLLDYFIKFLKQNSHLVKVNERMPDNFVHIINFKITKYAVMFALSNNVNQTIFQDGSEVHILKDKSKKKRVVFIDSSRNRTILEPGLVPEEHIKRRLEHINECLKMIAIKNEKD